MSYKVMMPGDMLPGAPNGSKGGNGLMIALLSFVAGAGITFLWMRSTQAEMMKRVMRISQDASTESSKSLHLGKLESAHSCT
jgi:hypothetical protein